MVATIYGGEEKMRRPINYLNFTLAIFAVILALGCAPSPEKSAGQQVDDAWITSKVKSALVADPQVSGTDIQVETYKGQVQLSGFVASEEQVREAIDITRGIEGVKGVENMLIVK